MHIYASRLATTCRAANKGNSFFKNLFLPQKLSSLDLFGAEVHVPHTHQFTLELSFTRPQHIHIQPRPHLPLPDRSTRSSVACQAAVDVHGNARIRALVRPRQRDRCRRTAPSARHRHLRTLKITSQADPSATHTPISQEPNSPRCKIVPVDKKSPRTSWSGIPVYFRTIWTRANMLCLPPGTKTQRARQ
jgi:hypothetical protein